jgi:hypothetical protein
LFVELSDESVASAVTMILLEEMAVERVEWDAAQGAVIKKRAGGQRERGHRPLSQGGADGSVTDAESSLEIAIGNLRGRRWRSAVCEPEGPGDVPLPDLCEGVVGQEEKGSEVSTGQSGLSPECEGQTSKHLS